MHITGLLKFCSSRNLTSGRNKGERTGHLEGYSSRQCAFEDLQRCATSRWLTDGCEQKLKLLDVAWQCPDYSLLFPCSSSFAESFVTCLRNKAHVYFYFTYASRNRQVAPRSVLKDCVDDKLTCAAEYLFQKGTAQKLMADLRRHITQLYVELIRVENPRRQCVILNMDIWSSQVRWWTRENERTRSRATYSYLRCQSPWSGWAGITKTWGCFMGS